MELVRLWLTDFARASFARARARLRFDPAVRVVLNAAEPLVLGAIDEMALRVFRYLEQQEKSMNWSTIIGLILEIVRKLLERKLTPDPDRPTVGSAPGAAMTDRDADQLASRLESAVADVKAASPPNVAGQPVGHPGGVIAHLSELVAALRARDWNRVQTLVVDLLTHL